MYWKQILEQQSSNTRLLHIIINAPSGDWSTKIERVLLSDHCSTSKPPRLDKFLKFNNKYLVAAFFFTNIGSLLFLFIHNLESSFYQNMFLKESVQILVRKYSRLLRLSSARGFSTRFYQLVPTKIRLTSLMFF